MWKRGKAGEASRQAGWESQHPILLAVPSSLARTAPSSMQNKTLAEHVAL